jgi:ComF family protein
MIAQPFRRPQKWGRSILEILYPRNCLCCGQPLLFNATALLPICDRCEKSLAPIQADRRCPVCSIPLISELDLCTRCSIHRFSFTSNFSVYEYRGAIREIISQFKFSNHRSLAHVIARLLHPALESRYHDPVLVPVPGSRRAVRRRGWDPIPEVTRVLQRTCGMKTLHLLRRGRGGPQKGLHYQERMNNIRGTIQLRKTGGKSGNVPERVVLLDDIFTSGATADECARMLRLAGVREVSVLTLAIEL